MFTVICQKERGVSRILLTLYPNSNLYVVCGSSVKHVDRQCSLFKFDEIPCIAVLDVISCTFFADYEKITEIWRQLTK